MKKIIFTFVFTLSFFIEYVAQPVKIDTPTQIKSKIEKLKVLGSVLYIAAHPDDENEPLLAYLALGKKYRSAYMSLTRGDGGQNLIGPEIGAQMGLIRTYELLEARKIDGAEQFFSRAIDFGYSKTIDETIEFWGEDNILSDIVRVYRKFKPDVIITRFPVAGFQTHGHHTASAMLALKAFRISGKTDTFPEQLKVLEPFQPTRIFHNDWRPRFDESVDKNDFIKLNVGEYSKDFGKSYSEIGAESRSMHKSQGFGDRGKRGEYFNFVRLLDGEPASTEIMDGVETNWNRVKGAKQIPSLIENILEKFDSSELPEIIDDLLNLRKAIEKLDENHWTKIKIDEINQIILDCTGLWFEVISEDYSSIPGGIGKLNFELVNRSDFPVKLKSIELPFDQKIEKENLELKNNTPESFLYTLKIPESAEISNPYWLRNKSSNFLFDIEDENLIGKPVTSGLTGKFIFDFNGTEIAADIPILHRSVDRVDGEIYRKFEIRPPITANFEKPVYLSSSNDKFTVAVKLKNFAENHEVKVRLNADPEWKIENNARTVLFDSKYQEKIIEFIFTPPAGQTESELKVVISAGGKQYNQSINEVEYSHIPKISYLPLAVSKLVKVELENRAKQIGYVEGAGDEIPGALIQLGCEVQFLSDAELLNGNLNKFDAIVTGIRAFNTQSEMKNYLPGLLKYVEEGGTLLVQYNVSFGIQVDQVGPYPFTISRDRITEEDAKINILDLTHPLMHYPNKITQKDFENWVQERGLYFAGEWDEKYVPLLSGNDKGESLKNGSLLYTQFGEGVFIYTGISFFRQLPAGVPGAYRLFVNLISGGKQNEN
ncbi:MAG: PIG-L family deacetylase [Melioribacteraceae bacterium]|nr:PIG-L family deacetylase [Melioribacteraceae bacterium]